jgi:hypothetical protein
MRRLLPLLALALAFALPVPQTTAQDDKKTSAETAKPDYLIICANGLKDSAREWAAYRESHGRKAKVVTLADIAKLSDVENPGVVEIKNFIQQTADGIEDVAENLQVLLIGDCPDEGAATSNPKSEIPWFLTRQEDANADPKRRSRIPTDNFYADIIPDDDNLPEIAIGRIPARDNASVRTALGKVKAYEAAAEGEWLRKLTFFAGEGRFGPIVDAMLEKLFMDFADQSVHPAYSLRMTYANVNSSYAYVPRHFSDKVIDEANEGSLMLVYLGHGSYDRLDNMYVNVEKNKRVMYPILLGDDVKKFDIPDGKLPVMLIVACQTGYMDHPKGSLCERVCFGENAPVAVIASSRDSHPYSNTLLQKALVTEITDKRRATLGEAFLRTKRELILAKDPDRKRLELMASLIMPKADERRAMNQAHLSLYNLTGDPGLRVRYPGVDVAGEEVRTDSESGKLTFAASIPLDIAEKLEWECTIEVARTAIAGKLEPVNAADLTSEDANVVKAAEEAIARNHATSNDKTYANVTLEKTGQAGQEGSTTVEQHFEGKPERALAPGDYILKLSARDKAGKRYGFTGMRFTVKQ